MQPTRRSLLLACLALPLAAEPAIADSGGNAAAAFIRSLGDDALRMLQDGSLAADQRRARFATLVSQRFDLQTIAQLAMGRYWRSASAAERTDYTGLFTRFVLDVYARRLDQYRGQTIRVAGAVAAGSDQMVESWIEGAQEPVQVDWRVRATPGGLKIVDVVVAGVSMLVTQRSEFASVIERAGGVPGLISHLRARVDGTQQQASAG